MTTKKNHDQIRPDAADWIAIGLGVVALGLRLFDLGHPSASFYDELTTLARSLAPTFGEVIRAARWQYPPYIDFQPPLYYLIVHAFISLGHTDFFARLPAALSGALSVPLLYCLGRRLGGRTVGLFAAAALTVNLHHIDVSQQTRLYAFFGFVSLGALWALGRALGGESRKNTWNWCLYSLFLTLGLYTSYLAAGTVLAGIGWTFLAWLQPSAKPDIQPNTTPITKPHSRWYPLLGCALATTAAALAFLPWIAATAGMRHYLLVAAAPNRPPLFQALTNLFSAFSSHYAAFTGRPELPWLLAGPALLGLLAGLAGRRRRGTLAALVWFAAAFFPVWIEANTTHHFQARYLLPCLFPVLLLGGMAVAALADRLGRGWAGRVAGVLLPLLCGLALAGPSLPMASMYYRRDDSRLRTLAAFLRDQAGPGVGLAFAGFSPPWTPTYFQTFVRWYLPGVFESPLPQANRAYRLGLLVVPDTADAPHLPKEATLVGKLARVAVYRLPLVNAAPILAQPNQAGHVFFQASLDQPAAFAQIYDSRNIRLGTGGLTPADRDHSGSVTYALAPLPGLDIGLTRLALDTKVAGYPGKTPTGRVAVLVGASPKSLVPYDPGALPKPAPTLYVRLVLEPGPQRETVQVTRLAVGARVSGEPSIGATPAAEQQRRLAANTEIVPEQTRALYPGRRVLAATQTPPKDVKPVAVIGDTAYIDPALSPDFGRVSVGKPLILVNPGPTPLSLAAWKVGGPMRGPRLTLGKEAFQIPLTGKAGLTALLAARGHGTARLTPLYTPDGYAADQADATDRIVRLANQPALSCPDGKPCSVTYALVTGYPAQKLSLTWFPRVFSDPAGRNFARASYSTDGKDYLPLDALASSGSGRWEGLGVGRQATADLGSFTGTLRIRFELASDAAQLWSCLETPLTMAVRLDTKSLPRLILPPGDTTLTADCPDTAAMLVMPMPSTATAATQNRP